MKNILRILSVGALAFGFSACANFEEINKDPQAADANQAMPYYALNRSIIYAQQNPDTGERLFVINWASLARHDGEDGYGTACGQYNDDHTVNSYNYMCNAIKYAVDAIDLCDLHLSDENIGEHDALFLPNVKAFARIWKVYLMTEFADSFGPMPIDGFAGTNPEFKSVKDVYYYFYDELEDAISNINLDASANPTASEQNCDPAYKYDAAKWKAYGISLWMRLAMRLSEADPAKAQEEFETALAAGDGILTADQIFSVQERSGWDDLSGVMSRTWDYQTLSSTMANLMMNLGTSTRAALADPGSVLYVEPNVSRYEKYFKDQNTYLGKKYADYYSETSDNPTKQYFFDGLPETLDPRAFVYFTLPGDYNNRIETGYATFPGSVNAYQKTGMFRKEKIDDKEKPGAQKDTMIMITGSDVDATYAWNGLPAGWTQDDKVALNGLVTGQMQEIPNPDYNSDDKDSKPTIRISLLGYGGTYPQLAEKYRNNTQKRVFFAPWETYFLLAEAAVRGWNAGIGAQEAYEAGIKASLDYTGMGALYSDYIASTSFNRVGTSVSWNHTAEPTPVPMNYVDGMTGQEGTTTYNYPDASKILYKGKALNDHLTKIITQKYIANAPWLPLENLCDHSRLGLPFWDIPAPSRLLPYMPEYTLDSYTGSQKPGYFAQRMVYPSSLRNADPTGYETAVQLLGGPDSRVTPLWWAIGGHE